MKYLISILLIISLATGLKAQQKWTLQRCLEYAEFNNIELQQQSLNLEMQGNYLKQSRAARLPSLNANVNQSVNFGKTVDLYTNDFAETRVSSMNLYMQGSITLFDGLRLLNTVKREALELEAQKYDLNYAKDMLSLQITTSFLQILYNTENLKNQKEQISQTEKQLERTRKLFEAGTLSESDLLNIKSQLASEQLLLVQAENQLDMSYLNLKQTLNLPREDYFEIEIPEIDISEVSTDLLPIELVYNTASENRPEIKSAELRIEKSHKNLSVARSAYSPSLNMTASVGTGYSGNNKMIDGDPVFNGFFPNGNITSSGDTVYEPSFDFDLKQKSYSTQFDENQNYSVGLYLSIPIFNKFQTKLNVENSKINIEQAKLQLEIERNNLRKTIEQSYADAKAAIKKYNAVKTQVEALEESFSYATKKFDAGLISAFEYNDAKVNLNIAQGELINAKFEYLFRLKVLEFYYGKPLSL